MQNKAKKTRVVSYYKKIIEDCPQVYSFDDQTPKFHS